MAAQLWGDIRDILKEIEGCADPSKKDIARIAENITDIGNARLTIPLDDNLFDKKAPHAGCQYSDCELPSLLIEVARSQEKPELRQKAEHYIRESHGEIRTVIGVNLNDIYKAQRKENEAQPCATFTVWRAEYANTRSKSVKVRASAKDQVLFPLLVRHKDHTSENM
jgi:hypothetical protein